MKEATGEVSMTVVTLVAIAVIGAIVAAMWPQINNRISRLWGSDNCSKYNADGSHLFRMNYYNDNLFNRLSKETICKSISYFVSCKEGY